jgi:hypothetical protein
MPNVQHTAARFLMPNWFTGLECLMLFHHVAVKLTSTIRLLLSSQVWRKQNFLKTCIDMKLLSFFLGSFLKFLIFFGKIVCNSIQSVLWNKKVDYLIWRGMLILSPSQLHRWLSQRSPCLQVLPAPQQTSTVMMYYQISGAGRVFHGWFSYLFFFNILYSYLGTNSVNLYNSCLLGCHDNFIVALRKSANLFNHNTTLSGLLHLASLLHQELHM